MAPITLVRDGTLVRDVSCGDPADVRVPRLATRSIRAEKNEEDPVAEAYCVKDKKKVEIKDPEKITMKNGKPATKGTCPECGGSVFRIGG